MSEPTKEPYTYEGARNQLKLGPFTTCVMILKTTVGVGIFTFQYCYALVSNQKRPKSAFLSCFWAPLSSHAF